MEILVFTYLWELGLKEIIKKIRFSVRLEVTFPMFWEVHNEDLNYSSSFEVRLKRSGIDVRKKIDVIDKACKVIRCDWLGG